MRSLPDHYRAMIIGASGAIGQALCEQLKLDPRCGDVCALSRSSSPSIDFLRPESIAAAATQLANRGPWHLLIIATGTLHGPTGQPEKRLSDLRSEHLATTLAVNTIGPALVLGHFAAALEKKERTVVGVLSAKVGSIEDNHLGGWYSYRASKAALNMLIKTASIELARTHPLGVVAALHPGTVSSALSAPFRGSVIGRTPQAAAQDLLQVMDQLQPEDSGKFWAYDGRRLPW